MQPKPPLKALIEAARQKGMSMSALAVLARCSRMTVWRLYAGVSSEATPAGLRLREVLGSGEPSGSTAAIVSQVQQLVGNDPRRAGHLLDMLRNVIALVERGE